MRALCWATVQKIMAWHTDGLKVGYIEPAAWVCTNLYYMVDMLRGRYFALVVADLTQRAFLPYTLR